MGSDSCDTKDRPARPHSTCDKKLKPCETIMDRTPRLEALATSAAPGTHCESGKRPLSGRKRPQSACASTSGDEARSHGYSSDALSRLVHGRKPSSLEPALPPPCTSPPPETRIASPLLGR